MSIDKITPLDTFVSNDAPICYGILKPGDHYECGIPVIKVKNIVGGKILQDDLLKTTPEIHAQYKRAEVKEGDILLTIRGTTGRVAIVPNSLNGANITQDTARIRVSSNDDSLYIFYALQSFNVQQQITLNTVGQAVKGINIAEVKKLKIYHPILDEQKKIAQILLTWDQAISATEKLLENSQQQKKALMQQLLTGKKRLLDENGVRFSGEWQRFSLGSIAKVYQPRTISQSELSSDGYPVYGANGVIGYYSDFNHELEQIAVTCRGSTCGVVNWTAPKSWITGNAMVINVDGSISVDKKFLFYVLGSSDLKYLITGSGQPQITGDIKNHVVNLAPIKEQKTIAHVLTLADNEIDALKYEIECLKQEKKALMQQLLTGKKRVKVAA